MSDKRVAASICPAQIETYQRIREEARAEALAGLHEELRGLVRYTARIEHGPCIDAAAVDEVFVRLLRRA